MYFITAKATFYHRLSPSSRIEVDINVQAENPSDLKDKFFGYIGGERDMFVFSRLENFSLFIGEQLHKANDMKLEDLHKVFKGLAQ